MAYGSVNLCRIILRIENHLLAPSIACSYCLLVEGWEEHFKAEDFLELDTGAGSPRQQDYIKAMVREDWRKLPGL